MHTHVHGTAHAGAVRAWVRVWVGLQVGVRVGALQLCSKHKVHETGNLKSCVGVS